MCQEALPDNFQVCSIGSDRFSIYILKADSEIRMHDGTPNFPNPSIFIHFLRKNGKRVLESIDLANAVIFVFVFFGKHAFFQ